MGQKRRWESTLIVLLAGAVLSPPLGATQQHGSIGGVVRTESGSALPHAWVTLAGHRGAAATDGTGAFLLPAVPAGEHRLEIRATGHAPRSAPVTVRPGARTAVTVTLVPTPLEMPGVQVTATPEGQDGSRVAQANSQLSGRSLQRRLGSTLGQTLEGMAGISMRFNGPAAAMPVVRGLTGDRLVILQDGQRTGDLAGSADDHSVTVDPHSVQRVEVVRGPASLLHGTSALGGVINVISGDIAEGVPSHATGSVTAQSESAFPGLSLGARGVVPVTGRWAVSSRGAFRNSGDVRIGTTSGGASRLPNTYQRSRSGSVGVAYGGARSSGGASVQAYRLEHGVPMPPEEAGVGLEGRKISASTRYERKLDTSVFSSLGARATVTDYEHEELEGDELLMAFALRTVSGDVQLRQTGWGPLRNGAWGASLLARSYAVTGEEQLTAPAEARAIGFFTYQELALTPRGAMLQAGARLDRHAISSRSHPAFGPGADRRFSALSGSLGLALPLGDGITGALSAARAHRAPAVEELFSGGFHAGTASYEVGDPGLEPERALGVEALIRVALPRVRGELNVFRKELGGFIHLEQRGDTVVDGTRWPVLAYAQGGATLHGFEAQTEVVLLPGIVVGALADAVRGELLDGERVPFLPAARLAGTARWERGPHALGGGVRHALARPGDANDREPSPAYTLLDLHAGTAMVRGGRVHALELRVENATDRLYRDAASRIKDFAPNPGRNVSLLYRVSF